MKKQQSPPVTQYTFKENFKLGTRTSFSIYHDPIHIAFVLARYKFIARMLAGKTSILEIGCGDGIGTLIVAKFVDRVIAVDMDKQLIESNKKMLTRIKNIQFQSFDYCKDTLRGQFDAVFSIDVMEHIPKTLEPTFMKHTCMNLKQHGICIIGTPNVTADQYASVSSRGYHINLKSQDSLRKLLEKYFYNVFMFSMNDEVVHTGFGPMAHYLFGIGVGVKKKGSSYA